MSLPNVQMSGNSSLEGSKQDVNYVRRCKQEKKHLRKNTGKVVIKGK